jgi:hypothetical protein
LGQIQPCDFKTIHQEVRRFPRKILDRPAHGHQAGLMDILLQDLFYRGHAGSPPQGSFFNQNSQLFAFFSGELLGIV